MYLRICRRLGAALPFSVSSVSSAPCSTSWKDRPRPASLRKARRPSAKITSASSAWARGELVIASACLNSEAFRASHAAITADPFEAAVQDPPSTGDVGKDESPIFAVTASIGRPRASAPICARIVHVPVPMSDAAVDTSRWPSMDGHLEVSTAASDIGTGTWTILAQIGADALGLPMDAVTAKIGDSSLPKSPVEGGSWTAASNGSAVMAACEALKASLFKHAKAMTNSPLAQAELADVIFADGRLALRSDAGRGLSFQEVLQGAELTELTEKGNAAPSLLQMRKYISYTHSAVFAEVRVDEDLGVVRIPKIVCAAAGGRIINPKTARSQILGGVVMGIGMALHEEAMTDHRLGKIMKHKFSEDHVPAHADIAGIDVIFVDETDDKVSPLGVKGLGEIGIVGTAAAVANAIFNATGRRVRDFPITLDKLLAASA